MATTTLTRNAVRRGLFHRSSLPSALNVVTKQSSNWQLSRQTTTSTSFPASRIFTVNSVSQMNALGVALGTACSQGGDVVLVYGDLGVGKTVLSQGFVRGRTGMPSLVAVSPTFTVVSTYTHHQMQRRAMYWKGTHHIDLHRLRTEADLSVIDLPSMFTRDVSVVEWPNRLHRTKYMPSHHVRVVIQEPSTSAASTSTPDGKTVGGPRHILFSGSHKQLREGVQHLGAKTAEEAGVRRLPSNLRADTGSSDVDMTLQEDRAGEGERMAEEETTSRSETSNVHPRRGFKVGESVETGVEYRSHEEKRADEEEQMSVSSSVRHVTVTIIGEGQLSGQRMSEMWSLLERTATEYGEDQVIAEAQQAHEAHAGTAYPSVPSATASSTSPSPSSFSPSASSATATSPIIGAGVDVATTPGQRKG